MNAQLEGPRRVILMADDDEDDRMLTAEAIQRAGLNGTVQFFEDGVELMDYLSSDAAEKQAAFSENEIILLDINMPRKNGWQVLAELKESPFLRNIPVILLTTSSSSADVERSYNMGASSFITKPGTFKDLIEVVGDIGQYWFKTVRLPGHVSH